MRFLVALLLLAACSHERAERPDWNRKDAHRSCRGAIATYPQEGAPPCSAMSMCANEAALDQGEMRKLAEMAKQAGCAPF